VTSCRRRSRAERRTWMSGSSAASEWRSHLSIPMRPTHAFTFGISSVDVLYCCRDLRPRRTRDPAPTGAGNLTRIVTSRSP
jgi:hypothetical protein